MPITQHRDRAVWICALLLASVAIACLGDKPEARETYTITDSAGVTIVNSEIGAWTPGKEWRIDDKPLLSIGIVNGEPGDSAYMLDGPHSPYRMSDGRIAVANGGTNQIRYFDSTGRFIKAVGREGQGPGEWSQLYQMRRGAGDTVIVVAPINEHSFIDGSGKYVRRFDLKPVRDRPNMWGLGFLSNGYLFAYSLHAAGERPIPADAKGEENTLGRDTTTRPDSIYRENYQHFIYDRNGRMIDSVGLLPGDSEYGGTGSAMFRTRGYYAVRGDKLFFGVGDSHEIRVYRFEVADASASASAGASASASASASVEGRKAQMRLERLIRRTPDRPLEITPEVIEAHTAQQRKVWEERAKTNDYMNGAFINMQMKFNIYPARMPAQSRVMLDSEQNIWEQRYNIPGDTVDVFSVYNPDGIFLGLVQVPQRFRPSEIGSDYILGIWRNEDDVGFVRMFPLRKPR